MKITVQREELHRKLSDIQNIVEKKNTMPILNHFLLTAEKAGSYITATDLETALKEPIALEVLEEGKVCIPAKKLFEIVREMDGEITIEATEKQWVRVKAGKSVFRLAGLSDEEFPVWPSITASGDTEEVQIESGLLREIVEKTLYAAGESDTRYVLNGLLFHLKQDGRLTVVGTDGHRLALSHKTIPVSLQEEKKLIVSRKSISELRRFLGDAATPVRIIMGKSHLLFSLESVEFLSRLIEGTYPNYEQVLPAGNAKIATLEKDALMKALRRVSIMSKERSSAVKVEVDGSNMVVSASNPDIGEAKDEIVMTYTGDAMALAFNARYLLDALSAMENEKVVLKMNEPLSPVLLLEENKDDYKCVVMPMRV